MPITIDERPFNEGARMTGHGSLLFFVWANLPYRHIFRQPAEESMTTIMQRYMNQREQKKNLLNTLRRAVFDAPQNEVELEILKSIEYFHSFIDKQYVRHYYNPSAVSISFACRGIAGILSHLDFIDRRSWTYREDMLKGYEFVAIFDSFGGRQIVLDLLFTHYVFHRCRNQPCRNSHCLRFIHECCKVLEHPAHMRDSIKSWVRKSPALLMMYIDLLETHRTNIHLVRIISKLLGSWFRNNSFEEVRSLGEVSVILHELQMVRRLVNIAQNTPAMKAICTIFHPIDIICHRSRRAFRDLHQVLGAKMFILETVKKQIDHNRIDNGTHYFQDYYVNRQRYDSSPLKVLGLLSRKLLNDRHPRIETMFWETDISTALVKGLRSQDSAYQSLNILVQLLKISSREREKLRKIEGVVEYLQGVPNMRIVVQNAPDLLKNLADEATGYIRTHAESN